MWVEVFLGFCSRIPGQSDIPLAWRWLGLDVFALSPAFVEVIEGFSRRLGQRNLRHWMEEFIGQLEPCGSGLENIGFALKY